MILNILVDMVFLKYVYSLSTHAQDQSNSTLASLPSWLQARLRQPDQAYPTYVSDQWDLGRWRETLMVDHGIDRSAFALLVELNNCSYKGHEFANSWVAEEGSRRG